MIIMHYQGIGASSLTKKYPGYIDLESSCFKIGDERDPEWYKSYVQIAEHLSQQGHHVFVSSHAPVQYQLKHSIEDVIALVPYPSEEMREIWIRKLADRFIDTSLNKDFFALMNTKKCYIDNVIHIMESGIPTHVVTKEMLGDSLDDYFYNLNQSIMNYSFSHYKEKNLTDFHITRLDDDISEIHVVQYAKMTNGLVTILIEYNSLIDFPKYKISLMISDGETDYRPVEDYKFSNRDREYTLREFCDHIDLVDIGKEFSLRVFDNEIYKIAFNTIPEFQMENSIVVTYPSYDESDEETAVKEVYYIKNKKLREIRYNTLTNTIDDFFEHKVNYFDAF